jgi:hypothetical protein
VGLVVVVVVVETEKGRRIADEQTRVCRWRETETERKLKVKKEMREKELKERR